MNQILAMKSDFDRWFNMYSKEYQGGGGGIGHFTGSKDIYFQAYNGDNNYHTMPSSITKIHEKILKEMAPEIFKRVSKEINNQIINERDEEIERLNKRIEKLNSIEA